ncbi:MAG: recombinase [Ectothiorhodospiraceae bacterium]|nr:recombinase [Ectothiorhodospiraceae bacterium]
MKVTLRERTVKSGRTQLYFDIYYGDGKRKTKAFGTLSGNRQQDKEARRIAGAARSKLEIELLNESHGFHKPFQLERNFFEFFDQVMDNKKGNYGCWKSTRFHLVNFVGKESLHFKTITPQWLESLKSYLLSQVAPNTARGYYAAVRETLKRAVREEIIPDNPSDKIDNIKPRNSYRPYLTLEELNELAVAPCGDPEVERAFLFSCLTGLRLGDVRRLQWKHVHMNKIEIVQKKTSEPIYLSLNDQAIELLGQRGDNEERIFAIPSDSHLSLIMRTWASGTGINKKITFHTARHTFATLALTNGVEIYTVSKLLGHSRLETTQVYAKIIDAKKEDAVKMLPKIKVK